MGGGYGFQSRALGLAIDQLVEIDVAVVQQQRAALVTASRNASASLFWAMLGGGGGNFGVAVRFRFKTAPLPPVVATLRVDFPNTTTLAAFALYEQMLPRFANHITIQVHRSNLNIYIFIEIILSFISLHFMKLHRHCLALQMIRWSI